MKNQAADSMSMRAYTILVLLLCLVPRSEAISRAIVPFDDGWRFHLGDLDGASVADFDDTTWAPITLPHTWNTVVDPPQADYYRGPGWYRKSFQTPKDWKNRRVFVKFGAASLVAQVFLNGTRIGEHKGGFAAFCFELTPYLKLGSLNVLAVRVDNSPREDVSPLSGDFTVFGGLYRSVSLIVTAPLAITPLDYGSPGVFTRQHDVSADDAKVDATAEISNGSAAAQTVKVRFTLEDRDYAQVATARKQIAIPAGQTLPVTQMMAVKHPHLWNGTADPYLYTIRVEVVRGNSTVDIVEQPLGLRFFRFDPKRGLLLNGERVEIHGVDRHQDWAGLGWAIGPKEQDIDMQMMREMGVNAVRLAHYQHNDYFYQLADRNGLIVWAELAMVNWVRDTAAFRENVRQQLIELIRQNMNHPSILMWSLYNELKPANTVDPAGIVGELNELAKKEDPSRPTTGALSLDGIEKLHKLGEATDLLALNVYPGWYVQTPNDMGSMLDKWNEAYGSRGIILSEYGAGASIKQHQQIFVGRSGRAPNDWHPEEWQSIVHEANYAEIRQRPFVFASFIWTMFDFSSANRKEGDQFGINDKGLVTRDRKIRKDAYFFYQSNWTKEPMVYITSRRDVERKTNETPLKVYSNCNSVSATVNDRPLDAARLQAPHVFVWPRILLDKGNNRVKATATCATRQIDDEVRWHVESGN